jgi:hypothetical protein
MNFSAAKCEFECRYYHWALSEWEREIAEGCPNLRLFRTGPAWQLLEFMRPLDLDSQRALGHALINRFHPDATKALGDVISPQEEFLRRKLDRFRHDARSSIELEIDSRQRDGERVKFMNKRMALNIAAEKFRKTFGNDCIETKRVVAGDPSLSFCLKPRKGWLIYTYLWFGRKETMIDYSHLISSERTFQQQGHTGPFTHQLTLAFLVSFCSWLGICSQSQWEYLVSAEDVDYACDGVIKVCDHFFRNVSVLLDGLDEKMIRFHSRRNRCVETKLGLRGD